MQVLSRAAAFWTVYLSMLLVCIVFCQDGTTMNSSWWHKYITVLGLSDLRFFLVRPLWPGDFMIMCCSTLGKSLFIGIGNEWGGVLSFGGWLIHYHILGHVTMLFWLQRLYHPVSCKVCCGWWKDTSVEWSICGLFYGSSSIMSGETDSA